MEQWIQRVKECKDIPDSKKFSPEENVEVEEIGDGNLNIVVRLIGASGRHIIVKQSLPYVKCLGKDFPLGEERIDVEYKMLVKFHTLSPGSVPEPFTLDKPYNAVYMEDLFGYRMLRRCLMDGDFDVSLTDKLGRDLGIIHCETHVSKVGEDQIKVLEQHFENSNMNTLSQSFVFQRPFDRDNDTNKSSPEVAARLDTVYGDVQVLEAAKHMLDIFTHKKECLLHGDLHTGSIMISGSDVRIMDLEFGTVGPAAYDVGVLVAHFIFSYYRHLSIEEDNDKHRQFAYTMVDACKRFVGAYLQHMTASIGDRETYVDNLMSETAGFAGCEIVRRLIGAAHNADVEGLPHAEVDCLGAGIRLLQGYKRITNIDRLLVIALMLA